MGSRGLVALLLVIGTLAAAGGAGAVWLDRQALHTSIWTDTSAKLIADRQIRHSVAHYAAREALSRAGVLDQLPGSVRARLRTLTARLADRVVASGAVRATWRRASRQAQVQLLEIVDHGRPGDVVTLNLHPIVGDLLRSVASDSLVEEIPGASGRLLSAAPADAGRLTVLRADQLDEARTAVTWVRRLSLWLPIAAVAAFLLALVLGTGRRAAVLGRIGIDLGLAGAAAILARPLLRPVAGDRLSSGALDKAAAEHGWMIATGQLRGVGIVICAAAAVTLVVSVAAGLLGRGGARG